jgi:hypothetical protein
MELARRHDLSAALFAHGWTYEKFDGNAFPELENLFWALLAPYLYFKVSFEFRDYEISKPVLSMSTLEISVSHSNLIFSFQYCTYIHYIIIPLYL